MVKEFYENVAILLSFEINDIVLIQACFWEAICFLVGPYYQVLTYLMICIPRGHNK